MGNGYTVGPPDRAGSTPAAGARTDVMRAHPGTEHLTGIRAYAALYVFLIHAGGLGLRELGGFGERLVDDGRYGVVCFFVLSALTLGISIDRRATFSYGGYMRRRFLRIAPLYYVVCALCLLWPATYYLTLFGVEADATNLLWHVTFLNLFDVRYLNSLVGVEWTIPVEMLFYLVIPGAVILTRTHRGVVLVVAIACALYFTREPYVAWVADGEAERAIANAYCPQRYIVCFLAGLVLHAALRRWEPRLTVLRRPWLLLVALALWLLHVAIDLGSPVPIYTGLTVLVLLASGPENRLSQVLFTNPIARYLGAISYSIYLVHLPVTTLLQSWLGTSIAVGWLALVASLAVASLTYWTIERPFLMPGRAAGADADEAGAPAAPSGSTRPPGRRRAVP